MIYSVIIGGIAGWLAGKIMKGGGFGLLINILLGIVGGVLGGWIFDRLGITLLDNWPGDLLEAVIGAVVILFVAGIIKRR